MFEDVWQKVVHGLYRNSPAILKGYSRYCVKNETWPVLVPSTVDATLEGRLYFDILTDDLSRIDEFEGEIYKRTRVEVNTDTRKVPASVYVLQTDYYDMMLKKNWSPEEFDPHSMSEYF